MKFKVTFGEHISRECSVIVEADNYVNAEKEALKLELDEDSWVDTSHAVPQVESITPIPQEN